MSSSARKGASRGKRIVIRNFNVQSSLPETFEATTWSKLEAAVRAVHGRKAISYSLEELYNDVKNLCANKLGY